MNSLFAQPCIVNSPAECYFYHTTDLPEFGTVNGLWDLRGKEDQYLGCVQWSGKRVLEIGPASGGLTFQMERSGADVVSLEAPPDYRMEYCWDIPHCLPPGLEERIADSQSGLRVLHNSYWLCHRLFESTARVHYGSAYDIPPDLGAFDIATICCVLLHNKNPFRILEGVAAVTKEAIVVVEILPGAADELRGPVFIRGEDNSAFDGWFHFPPRFTARVLKTMGFGQSTITRHKQLMGGQLVDLYTVVAAR
jgi:hypothetical protein